MLTVIITIRSTKVLWYVEDDLRWKTTFRGRQPPVNPCMLPTPLCGILNYSDTLMSSIIIQNEGLQNCACSYHEEHNTLTL